MRGDADGELRGPRDGQLLAVGTAEPLDHALDLDYTAVGILDAAAVQDPQYDGLVGAARRALAGRLLEVNA